MNPIIRNIIAVVAGFAAGSLVNMGLVTAGPMVIPPPEGADVTTMEGLRKSLPLFEPANFLFPFLAHALGTLAGALTAALVAATHRMKFALLIGVLFLAGGITNVVLLPSPAWFTVLDLALAYIPMAWIGGMEAERWRRHRG